MATTKQADARAGSEETHLHGAGVGRLLVAVVRFYLDAENRVIVGPVGDLLVEIRGDVRSEWEWTPDVLDQKGRCTEHLSTALDTAYSTWFQPDQRAAFQTRLSGTDSAEIIVGVAPVSCFAAGKDLELPQAAKRWRSIWPKKGPVAALDEVQSLLRKWLFSTAPFETLTAGDAVLTPGGESWRDRLVTAYQGRDRKTGKQPGEPELREERLPPLPEPSPEELGSPDQALAFLQARFADPASPERRAVALLQAEFVRLRQLSRPLPGSKLPVSKEQVKPGKHLDPRDLTRIADLPDRAFFRQFDKLKNRIPRLELKDLLSRFLRKQVGLDFAEVADNHARFIRKQEFADGVCRCAEFVHCQLQIDGSGEIGNLTFGKGGTSASGQFQISRYEAGKKRRLLASSEFPLLRLVDA